MRCRALQEMPKQRISTASSSILYRSSLQVNARRSVLSPKKAIRNSRTYKIHQLIRGSFITARAANGESRAICSLRSRSDKDRLIGRKKREMRWCRCRARLYLQRAREQEGKLRAERRRSFSRGAFSRLERNERDPETRKLTFYKRVSFNNPVAGLNPRADFSGSH